MSSYSRQQLEGWLKTIDVNAPMVLDVGGAQNPVKGRTKFWNTRRYDIFDLPVPHEQNYDCDVTGNIENIDWNDIQYKGLEYDIAFCIEVSEYWVEPVNALRNIARFLKKGGLLYISFHFLYPMHNPVEKDYTRYTRWGVEELMRRAGFKIEELKTRTATKPDMLKDYYLSEKMRPSKLYNGHNEVGYLVCARKI